MPTTAEYTLFSSAHVTFSMVDHVLGHKEFSVTEIDKNDTDYPLITVK